MISPKRRKRLENNKHALRLLFKSVTKIKSDDVAKEFLQDLMSSSEIKDLSRRVLTAKMLYEKSTYFEISEDLGMSPITINKIHFKTMGSKVLRDLLKN